MYIGVLNREVKIRMIITFHDITTIKNLIDLLLRICINADVTIKFTENRIKLEEIDASKSTLVAIDIKNNNLKEYFCPNELSIKINLDSMKKTLKTIKKNNNNQNILENSLTLSIDENKLDKIKLSYKGNTEDITIDNSNYKHYKIDSVEYAVELKMNSIDLKKMLKSMINKSDVFKISVKNNKIEFFAGMAFEIEMGTFNIYGGINENNFEICYEVDKLMRFINCYKFSDDVELYVRENYPLGIKCNISDIGQMIAFICPCENLI
ncbi:MAG: proliferating cell nuclear antigen [Terrestrivirus sp.]|uniref:Proliferating cell nuclear antigen n=1 Tax=Terrestrivirus sp. TaxID=2487775 RepID=A0A3G4ZKK1_9VIRU|nr:MAG: proliferating cell nuclear antigen [Terrestrivirus sp.]